MAVSEANSEVVFHFCLDQAIAGGVADAEQCKAFGNLIIIEKALIRLINTATENLSSTGAAGSSTAGIGKINPLCFGGIKYVGVRPAGEAGATLDLDREGHCDWSGLKVLLSPRPWLAVFSRALVSGDTWAGFDREFLIQR